MFDPAAGAGAETLETAAAAAGTLVEPALVDAAGTVVPVAATAGVEVSPVRVDGAGTAVTPDTVAAAGLAFVEPGVRLTVHVTTFVVANPLPDVHTPGVTVVPDARDVARPSSAAAVIDPPEPFAIVSVSARFVYPLGAVQLVDPELMRSPIATNTGAFATPVVTEGDACVVPEVVSARDAIWSIGVVVLTPR
jgi:hypothetical protein